MSPTGSPLALRRSVALAAVLLLAVSISLPATIASPSVPAGQTFSPRDAGEGISLRLYFTGKTMGPEAPSTNGSGESTPAPGRVWGCNVFGTPIGTWSRILAGPVEIAGDLEVNLYAQSQSGAKDVGFRINMMKNGGETRDYYTNRQDVGPTPVLLTATGTYTQSFAAGDSLDIELVWISAPTYLIGPCGGGEFVYGSREVDSEVSLTFAAHPITIANITVPEDKLTRQKLTVKTDFTDALGAVPEKLAYAIAISGATAASPALLKGPVTSVAGNVTTVSWEWDHAADKAKSGSYTIAVTIGYDANHSVTNATTLPLRFDRVKVPPTNPIPGGDLGLIAIIGGVAAAGICIAAVVLIRRRQASAGGAPIGAGLRNLVTRRR